MNSIAWKSRLGVTTKTIRNWETGTSRIPYSGFALVRLMSGQALPDPDWVGWTLHSDTLWSPENNGFKPDELRTLEVVVDKARRWDRSQQIVKPPPRELGQLHLDGIGPIWTMQP